MERWNITRHVQDEFKHKEEWVSETKVSVDTNSSRNYECKKNAAK